LQRRSTPAHDLLEKRVSPQEQLEEEVDAHISDEPFARDPKVQEDHYYDNETNPNQLCPGGLRRPVSKEETAEVTSSGATTVRICLSR
jgi:hypothetical protein